MAFFECPAASLSPGRILFEGVNTASRTATGWQDVNFSGTAWEPDGGVIGVCLDPKFGHINSDGDIVVDQAIPEAYLAGYALRGVTSSGTATYCGVQILKNGTVISGATCYGNSTTASPYFRRVQTSFAVGDVIKVQTRVSSTTQAYMQVLFNIQWEGI